MWNGVARPGTGVRESTGLGLRRAVSAGGAGDPSPNRGAGDAGSRAGESCPQWDYRAALWKVGNDIDFFIEMARQFVAACPGMMTAIAAHLADGDLSAVEDQAAALGSSLRDLAAKPACRAAGNLENAARERDLGGVRIAFSALEQEMAKLNPELARIGRQLTRGKF